MRKQSARREGDPLTEVAFLKACSPLLKADRIKFPRLIAQSKSDSCVKKEESKHTVEAVRKAGNPVERILFPDEGHGFADPENRLKFFAAAEAFLAKHPGGGRIEPPDDNPRP